MNIITLEHVSKTFADKPILDDVSFGIEAGSRVGIVGLNGTGKTTLLRLISGELEADAGQLVRQRGLTWSMMSQHSEYAPQDRILDWVSEGAEQVWEAESVLNSLGIPEHHLTMGSLSGGLKRRAALAKAVLTKADVLILDEPTNHLDEGMLTWLEDYLKRRKGTLIMVTHDRYFLDRVSNHILEIDHGKVYGYDGGYSRFLELKAERIEMEYAAERKRRSVLRMELEWASRGCRARTTKQKARLQRLELLKNGTAPVTDSGVEISSAETRMGRKTVEMHHVTKSLGGRLLISDLDYIFLKNQRVGIIGPNGCRKSTLLKMLAGVTAPDAGSIEIGDTVKIGYFAQEVPDLDSEQRVIDYVKDIAEYITVKDGRISAAQMLERFLFTPEMQYAPVSKLSGGEKRRLHLLGVLQSGPNVLIMDEVSNELDISTISILEDYLQNFTGIVIMASHDRYFLDNVADRILAFEENGRIRQYEGGYTDYLEAVEKNDSGSRTGVSGRVGAGERNDSGSRTGAGGRVGDRGRDRRDPEPAGQKPRTGETKLKFSFREQREFETIDEDIAVLEEQARDLDAAMEEASTDPVRLTELMARKEAVDEELEQKMDRWVYLNDLAERIAAQKKG